MSKGQVLKIKCGNCGAELFRYYKDKRGNLLKIYIDRLRRDQVGLDKFKNEEEPKCPECSSKLGIITLVHGKPALKVNRGVINIKN